MGARDSGRMVGDSRPGRREVGGQECQNNLPGTQPQQAPELTECRTEMETGRPIGRPVRLPSLQFCHPAAVTVTTTVVWAVFPVLSVTRIVSVVEPAWFP